MSQDTLLVTNPTKQIIQISLNRPDQLNALSHEVLVQFRQLLVDIKRNQSIKAVLLTGEGRGFCAGADIKQLAALKSTEGLDFARFGQAVFRELELLGKPSLAAIHGFAFGGGCELAMAATLRMAASNCVFGQPEIKLGVIPGFGGTQRLSRLIGKGRALELCLTGRRFTAEEALQWGFLSEVTSADNLLPRALALLGELTQLGPFAQQAVMTAINRGDDLTLDDAFELEASQFGLCCATPDKNEGVNAFLEKRTPVFTGASG